MLGGGTHFTCATSESSASSGFITYFFRCRQKIDEQKTELERLENILDAKTDNEKKHIGNVYLTERLP